MGRDQKRVKARVERGEVREKIREMEKRMENLESGEKRGEWMKGVEGKREREEVEQKIKEIERKLEKRERAERKKNLIIRGLEVKEEKRMEAVEELMNVIGVEIKIREVWRIAGEKEKGREMVGIKVEEGEKRREILERKKKLRGRKERIMEDWTWKERRMRWRLEEIAKEEEVKGRKVRIDYGKIRIEEKWWRWDEEEEVLKDGKGNKMKERKGEGEEGEKGKEG